jgi:ADP-heptose:LPS heptosyltransferase
MKKILVFRTGQLGDTLVAVPSLRLIERCFSESQIDYLYDVHPGKNYMTGKDVLDGSLQIQDFIPYVVGVQGVLQQLGEHGRLLKKVRSKRYDLLVNLVQPPRSRRQLVRDRVFFRLAGIRRQIVAAPSESRGLASLSRPLQPIQHEADFLLKRLHEHGLPKVEPSQGEIQIPSIDSEICEARTWLSHAVPSAVRGVVAVAAGSKMQAKQWPLESFVIALKALWETEGVWPVFLGGPADAKPAQEMVTKIGAGGVAAGVFNIRGSLALLRQCDFYLGNDTGTMHLAVAAGLKCVAIFSARDQPGRWYPYGEGHIVHRLSVDCEGCMLQTCVGQKKRCLTEINPEDVLESCRIMWSHLQDCEGVKH